MVCCSNNSKYTCTRNPRRKKIGFLCSNCCATWNPFVHAQSHLGRVNVEQGVVCFAFSSVTFATALHTGMMANVSVRQDVS